MEFEIKETRNFQRFCTRYTSVRGRFFKSFWYYDTQAEGWDIDYDEEITQTEFLKARTEI